MADLAAPKPAFKPYIPDEQSLPELTVRALILGSLLGLLFWASSDYLGLRVGLTGSASISSATARSSPPIPVWRASSSGRTGW